MEEIVLEAELREETGRVQVKDLRQKNFIPAVVYGEGKEAQPVKVAYRALLHLLHEHRLENVVVSLKIKDDKKKKSRPCLIKDIQHHPVKGDIIHVDFHEISLTKAIKVSVPVTVKGEAPGVKLEGGSLEHILWEIEIECLPTEMPEDINVDVSHLKLGEAVHIKDVVFPANIKVLNDPDSIIVSVAAPMKEEVPVEGVEGEEKKEPEVIKEKKEVPAEGKEAEAKEK
jgi:large subunit ribosomal protein L25